MIKPDDSCVSIVCVNLIWIENYHLFDFFYLGLYWKRVCRIALSGHIGLLIYVQVVITFIFKKTRKPIKIKSVKIAHLQRIALAISLYNKYQPAYNDTV